MMSLFPAYSTTKNGILSESGDVIPLPPVPGHSPAHAASVKLNQVDVPSATTDELSATTNGPPASTDELPKATNTSLSSNDVMPAPANVEPSSEQATSLTSAAEISLQRELENLLSDSDTDEPNSEQAIDEKSEGETKSVKHKTKKKKDKKKKKGKKKKRKKSKRESSDQSECEKNKLPALSIEGSPLPTDSNSSHQTVLDNSGTLNGQLIPANHNGNSDATKRSRARSGSCQALDQKRSGSRLPQKDTTSSQLPGMTDKSSKRSHSQLSNDMRSRNRNSISVERKRRRTRSRSAENKRKLSQSRSRDVSGQRSHSKTNMRRRSCSRSEDRVRRPKKSRSRSPDRRQKQSRSRSRDRKLKRSQSRSRDKRQRKSRSRSRDRREKRSHKRSRSRSRDKKQNREHRSRSKSSNIRRRSRDRHPRRTRSRSGSRKPLSSRSSRRPSHSRTRRRSKSVSRQEKRKKNSNDSSQLSALHDNIPASSNKNVFVEIGSYVRYDYVVFTDVGGDKNNLAFPVTHYTQLVKYRAPRSALGDQKLFDKNTNKKSKVVRYFQKKVRTLLNQNALVCTPIQEIETDDALEKVYIPTELTYAETLKISKQKKEELKSAYEKSEFYLDAVDISNDEINKNTSADDTEYEYWMKQSKTYNERLTKEPKNEQLWLEFSRFQERAFVHLFRGGAGAESSGKGGLSQGRGVGKSAKALAERQLALLEAGIKKNTHSLALQLERLAVGDEVWELDQLNREWATLVYNFPNNMTVWHRYVEHHATSSLQFRVSSAVSAASRCCEKLRLMAAGVFVTHAPPQQPGLSCIDLIAQVCRLWAQSGYRERGVALWQALIEYNLFTPEALTTSQHEHRLPLLEQFWDSRAPRVGEVGSVGWGEALRTRQTAFYGEQILGERQHYDSVQYLLFWRLERRAGQFDEEDIIIEAAVSKHPILKLRNNSKSKDGSASPSPESASHKRRTSSDRDGTVESKTLMEDVADEAALEEERRRERAAAEDDAEYEARLSELWLQLEQLRERRHWLPYAADPDDCEDSDRFVSFEVLAPFVVLLPMADAAQHQTKGTISQTRLRRKWETDTEYEQFYLVLRFLDYLGVEVHEIEKNLLEYLGIHEYESNCFEGLRLESFDPLFDSDVLSVCQRYAKVRGLVPVIGPSLDDTANDSYFKFVCNVIEKTMHQFDTEYSGYLAVLYIKVITQRYKAFQQDTTKKHKLKKIEKVNKKLAKTLLKKEKFRGNLLVYKEYGALEECFGNFGEAEKVYITGLVVGSRELDVFECDAATFRRVAGVCFAYIRLHLAAAATYGGNEADVHTTSVLSVLCSLANEGRVLRADSAPVSPSTLLRARKKLAELLELAILTFLKSKKLTTCNNQIIVELCTYLALIQFFTSGFKSFCLIFEETISRIENSEGGSKKLGSQQPSAAAANGASNKPSPSVSLSRATALLLQALHEREAWLGTVLARLPPPTGGGAGTAFSPIQHRAMIQSALSSAPDSPLLLALMSKIQSWRDLFCGLGGPEATVRQLVFRVLPHISSASALLDNAVPDDTGVWCSDSVCVPRTVLSVLRGSVQRPSGRHCPLLWRLYLSWSALTQPGPATSALLYAALNNCPGNKSVYLSSVAASARRLKNDGSGDVKLGCYAPALRSTVRLMEERGLRCRLPLQELQLLLQEEHEERPERDDRDSVSFGEESSDSELEVLQESVNVPT